MLVHGWMDKKMWWIYTMDYYSAIENIATCNSMDGPGVHYAKWNKSEKDM